MIEILLIIIAINLWGISRAICELTTRIRPISEYYYKKQRNQLTGSDKE